MPLLRAALMADIIENPDDDTPRLVLADWLEENGDPDRAEFIRLQLLLANRGDDPTLGGERERAEGLLTRHKDRLLAELPQTFRKGAWFRRGFVEGINVTAMQFVREAGQLFRAAPVVCASLSHAWRCARELAGCVYLERLRYLGLWSSAGMNAAHAGKLFASPHLSGLRDLDLSFNRIGPLGAQALSRAPLSSLEKLTLVNNRIEPPGLFAIAHSQHLQRLRRLDLHGNAAGDSGLEHLAFSPLMWHLEHLDLTSNHIGVHGLRALAQSPGAGSLRSLSLEFNRLEDADVRVLLQSPYLSAPLELKLVGNNISGDLALALEQRFGGKVHRH